MMKNIYPPWPCIAFFIALSNIGFGQANRTLSNLLSTTSVNDSLVTLRTNTYNLGNALV